MPLVDVLTSDPDRKARVVSDTLQTQIYDLLRLVAPRENMPGFRDAIEDYVEAYPLRDLTFTRRSTMGYMAPRMSAIGPGGLSATGATLSRQAA